jgi:hypothetical protein
VDMPMYDVKSEDSWKYISFSSIALTAVDFRKSRSLHSIFATFGGPSPFQKVEITPLPTECECTGCLL